ncbi:MAG TPA: Asp-tRNA(Asn)/Glu-tRNA(Gln) amidotransferase subunit GatB [Bacillota bacterium]|nr:Asp-tRNA(Asn)/Glu-tRNA(Gln) amidotransferase subunit GatB [Candidatus Fermentithermobacillaceae bacterium]HAF66376.1 Asp-tRNA(Asn)/Glu-tRNA(Gln) amidotransferase GatCAB subunit B [Clostridiales bacterium UBA9857]HOA70369.1 Asp-tRNA(Asn)/Glu-tRNA(Gln) amidotransferase subunit GatB [Bacillota bacterium]HPT35441.1 Asp-tRNA(Asn)/Glu-tRNA(Gln) amidotransferase subunit GatB [Bacillota bacterium]HPZ84855.1 Asp-tRNA(Asn)/Glu-tRNA(Gln) amidotransferase subunit GatB [Bacillota bacterium]
MTDRYEMTIGLEVHVELATATKMFCRCSSRFGDPPNTNICPVCLGMPGALPQANMEAVRLATRAALALNCTINPVSRFDRKNYFYPDLPKGYQITQYYEPLAQNGHIWIDDPQKKIRINRVHIEEDAGKSLHAGDEITTAEYSLVDCNRAGVPLIEIVSEPDMSSPEEARQYLEKLQRVLKFAGVSDVKMEEGSMRVDCNISVRPEGSKAPGVVVEMKNLSSFRAVARALAYEFERQVKVLSQGGKIVRETRHWDETEQVTKPLRSKESSDDYRYFPDADLPKLELSHRFIEEIKREMPKLPDEIVAYYVDELGLPEYDAQVLTLDPALSQFFDACVALGADPKTASNWIMVELLGYMKANNIPYENIPLRAEYLVSMLELINEGVISGKIAKDVLVLMIETGQDPRTIVKGRGLEQISDEESIARVVDEVIAQHSSVVEEIKAGKTKALGFLVGQVMKRTKGKANPAKVNTILRDKLLS